MKKFSIEIMGVPYNFIESKGTNRYSHDFSKREIYFTSGDSRSLRLEIIAAFINECGLTIKFIEDSKNLMTWFANVGDKIAEIWRLADEKSRVPEENENSSDQNSVVFEAHSSSSYIVDPVDEIKKCVKELNQASTDESEDENPPEEPVVEEKQEEEKSDSEKVSEPAEIPMEEDPNITPVIRFVGRELVAAGKDTSVRLDDVYNRYLSREHEYQKHYEFSEFIPELNNALFKVFGYTTNLKPSAAPARRIKGFVLE
jgi:hypothetical protein